LLLIFVFAAAMSTMSTLFSASLCTIRYDMLEALSPGLAPGSEQVWNETKATRRTLAAGGLLALVFAAGFRALDFSIRIGDTNGAFLALVFASCCAQLSLAPLVIGPIVARSRVGHGALSPGWALAILGLGTASGVAAVVVYIVTGSESSLWAAVPASLGSGLVLFGIAHMRRRVKVT
jgi:Na+/proline symporter